MERYLFFRQNPLLSQPSKGTPSNEGIPWENKKKLSNFARSSPQHIPDWRAGATMKKSAPWLPRAPGGEFHCLLSDRDAVEVNRSCGVYPSSIDTDNDMLPFFLSISCIWLRSGLVLLVNFSRYCIVSLSDFSGILAVYANAIFNILYCRVAKFNEK